MIGIPRAMSKTYLVGMIQKEQSTQENEEYRSTARSKAIKYKALTFKPAHGFRRAMAR